MHEFPRRPLTSTITNLHSSDPLSPNFGRHWTAGDVVSAFAPSNDTVEAVRNWLIDSGIEANRILHTANKDWIGLDTTVEEAERLLKTVFHEHEHAQTGTVRLGCDE